LCAVLFADNKIGELPAVLCSVSAFSSNILTQNFECYVTILDFISLLCLVGSGKERSYLRKNELTVSNNCRERYYTMHLYSDGSTSAMPKTEKLRSMRGHLLCFILLFNKKRCIIKNT
jgi:hypothetical protein